jgi:hypothetical protein
LISKGIKFFFIPKIKNETEDIQISKVGCDDNQNEKVVIVNHLSFFEKEDKK